jgi:hypothetical protein
MFELLERLFLIRDHPVLLAPIRHASQYKLGHLRPSAARRLVDSPAHLESRFAKVDILHLVLAHLGCADGGGDGNKDVGL